MVQIDFEKDLKSEQLAFCQKPFEILAQPLETGPFEI